MKHELAFVNARAWTGDHRRPWVDALATAKDRISFAGSASELRKQLGKETRLLDARGALILPGFNDAHVHFVEGGLRLGWVRLNECASRDEFEVALRSFTARNPGSGWLLGGDWDHSRWGGALPSSDWIDAAVPDRPVWLTRHDGHMGAANRLALRLAGLDAWREDPPGGTIVRDEAGHPTGVLKDSAMQLVAAAIPALGAEREDAALDAAMTHVASFGVTSVQNMGTWENLEVFRRAHAAGRLRTRIHAAVPLRSWERLSDEVSRSGRGDSWLRVGMLKEFMDGSLGSRTALFHAGYADDPANCGLALIEPAEALALIGLADRAGLQCAVHAIGDMAVSRLLQVFESVIGQNGVRDRRFRVEHAQHVRARDLPRFAASGIIASMQPWHAVDDGRWAEAAIGPARAAESFPIGSLMSSGAHVAFGSDWFVAPPDPIRGIAAAVSRRTLDGRHPGGWCPEQRTTVEQAISAYTIEAARAEFQEGSKGTLTVGKLADLVVLDRDITNCELESLAAAQVLVTLVGGEPVYGLDRLDTGF